METTSGEPVWPSGKALGWSAEGPRFDPPRLSFLYKLCGLWTLSNDFVNTVNETLSHTAARLNASGGVSVTGRW